jgi:ribosome-associated protein
LVTGIKEGELKVAGKVKNNVVEVNKILELVKVSLDDGKAEDITVIDLEGKSSIASYMVVASGNSNRHVAALAENLQMKLKENGCASIAEGFEKADWVLIDAYDVIVHIFRPEVREFYSLEKMWSAVRTR